MQIPPSFTAAPRRADDVFSHFGSTPIILHPRQDVISPSLTGGGLYRGHLATVVVCTVLTTLFVWARMLVKWRTGTKWFSDDWTCMVGWVAYLGFAATPFAMIPYGLGIHVWQLTDDQIQYVTMWLYGSSVTYCPATYMIKTTLLLLIARVFASSSPRISRNIHIFIFVLLIAYLPIQIIKVFICTPIAAQWNPTAYPNATCLPQRKVFIADLVLAITTDLVILIMPVPLVWGYSFDLRKKIKISVLLGAGGVATATTAYRMYFVVEYVNSMDSTYDAATLDLLAMLELTIGMVCACLPTLNMFFARKRSLSRSRGPKDEQTRCQPQEHLRYPFHKQHVRHDETRPKMIGSEDKHSKASRLRRSHREHGTEKAWWGQGGHGADVERQFDGLSIADGEDMTRMTSATTAVGSAGLGISRCESRPGDEFHHARWGSGQADIDEDNEDCVYNDNRPMGCDTSSRGLGSKALAFGRRKQMSSDRPEVVQRKQGVPALGQASQSGLPEPGHLVKIDSDLGRREGWLSPVTSRREEAKSATDLARHTTSTKKTVESITETHASWGEEIPSRPGTSNQDIRLFSIFSDSGSNSMDGGGEGSNRATRKVDGSDWIWDGPGSNRTRTHGEPS